MRCEAKRREQTRAFYRPRTATGRRFDLWVRTGGTAEMFRRRLAVARDGLRWSWNLERRVRPNLPTSPRAQGHSSRCCWRGDGRPMAAGSANRWMFRVAVMMARGRGQWRAGKKATPFRPSVRYGRSAQITVLDRWTERVVRSCWHLEAFTVLQCTCTCVSPGDSAESTTTSPLPLPYFSILLYPETW